MTFPDMFHFLLNRPIYSPRESSTLGNKIINKYRAANCKLRRPEEKLTLGVIVIVLDVLLFCIVSYLALNM